MRLIPKAMFEAKLETASATQRKLLLDIRAFFARKLNRKTKETSGQAPGIEACAEAFEHFHDDGSIIICADEDCRHIYLAVYFQEIEGYAEADLGVFEVDVDQFPEDEQAK